MTTAPGPLTVTFVPMTAEQAYGYQERAVLDCLIAAGRHLSVRDIRDQAVHMPSRFRPGLYCITEPSLHVVTRTLHRLLRLRLIDQVRTHSGNFRVAYRRV